ncbi:family 78 glycoside hydrolase catalytic domain [Clostridium sp. NSJ-27]|uniref:alpha-L-rhamnosidase n=2 Tax=Clostridium facile TaxID=2763035 RepID=A0ABR7ISZ7_9CLOT|nr:family 78 glycoside hydrolase catalytic domain [Clostridium facile]
MLSVFTPINIFAADTNETTITNLRTEDAVNPVGIDVTNPTFSWQMESSVIGQHQTAYQVVVAKDKDLSQKVWDSKKQESSVSIGIQYAGDALQASTTYFWQVTVWDKDQQAIQSDIATFEMGLLGEDAWNDSQWIQMGTSTETPVDPEPIHLDYTLEADIQIVNTGVALVFEAEDKDNYLMWQVRTAKEDATKLQLRPHFKKNGNFNALEDVDITEYMKEDVKAVQHLKIEVTNDQIDTYINGNLVNTCPKSSLAGVGLNGEIGNIGFRTSSAEQEDGWLDNIVLTDYSTNADGIVVKNYNFDDGKNPFGGGTIVDGRLSTHFVGSDDTYVEPFDPETGEKEPVHYVVEADVTCSNTAVSLLFNAMDSNNFYMVQLNIKDQPGKVMFKPHTWKNGSYATYASHTKDVTSAIGSIEEFKTKPAHIKLDVTQDEINTYINNQLVDTFTIGEISDQSTTGIPVQIGMLGFRADGNESGTVDNFTLVDYTDSQEGEVVYNYHFDDGQNPFLQGSINENGEFVASGGFGILLPPQGIPTFRKEITPEQNLASAKLYVTGLGVFDVFINGERVGTRQEDGSMVYDELKPGYTQPLKRVFSYTYDVTQMINEGEANTVVANVSSGWWNGAVAGNQGKNNAFRAQILLTYTDGSQKVIGTDRTWKTSLQGPIVFGDIFNGETYDANADTSFRYNGYDDSTWNYADINQEFSGEIVSQIGPSVRVREDLTVNTKTVTVYDGAIDANESQHGKINVTGTYQDGESFTLQPNEKAVIDLGQNFAGWEKIQVEGPKGAMLTMRHGEMLNDNDGLKSRGNDGPEGSIYTANLRSAQATGRYILSGNGIETYQASATFYGFRYLEISTTQPVTIHNVKGIVVTSVAENTGTLSTGNADVNQLISNIFWGQYSNYLSVPTDCPQRDERQGWSADTQVFSTAASYNADSKGFLQKWMQDMKDSQASNGAYPDTAPATRFGGTGQLGWADAGIIVPYNLYKMYGDKSVIEENYESMQKYIDVFLASTDKKGAGHSYGDWLAYESNDDDMKSLLGIAYYAWDAQMMAEMAEVLGKTDDVTKYQEIYEIEKEYFQQQYVNEDGSLKRGEQTACLFALFLDLLPNEESEAIVEQTLLDNISRNGNKLQTGFLGTSIIMQTLSKIGADDVAYQLLLQHGNPSWLYSVDQGATTIWERWNSYTKETGFGDVGMNSFNHYSYGAVAEWMYGYMAGIMYDFDQPGFKHIVLQPTPDQLIGHVDCSYTSEYGTIVSNWDYEDGQFIYDAVIPANTTATIYVPVEDGKSITVNGKAPEEVTTETDGLVYVKTEDGKAVFEAVSGSYQFKAGVTEYCYIDVEQTDETVPYQISVNGGELQSVPTTIKTVANEPITIQAVVKNDVDYSFQQWSGDATSTDQTITITPTDNMTLSAQFKWSGYDDLALGAKVTANSVYTAAGWSADYLTDGILNHLGGNNGFTSDSYGTNSPDISNNPFELVVDLGEVKEFDRIQLYPRTDDFSPEGKTFNFPVKYEINISENGIDYTTIYEQDEDNAPVWKPLVISCETLQQARYIQVRAFTLGTRDVPGSDGYRFQLAELGVYNTTESPEPPVETDKDILNKVIVYAEEQKASDDFNNVIADVQESFNAALDAAKEIAADPAASQDAVDAAWKALMTEIHKLGFVKGDITSLEDLVALAETYDINDYVEAGQAEFQEALKAAQDLLADKDNAMAEEIEVAESNLLNAILNLRYKANKSILEKVIAEANEVDSNAYTVESYAVLEAAVAEANAVMANENATQEEVDAAVTSVQEAMKGLVAVEKPSTETPDDNKADSTQTGQESTTTKANAAKTGDFAPIAGIMVLALAGTAAILSRRKK